MAKTKNFVDYYSLLGISPDADLEEINIAYQIQRRNCFEENTPTSTKRLTFLDDAIELLSDEESRADYDAGYEDDLIDAKEALKPNFVDYSKFRKSVYENWQDLYNLSQPIGSIVGDLINSVTVLPEKDLQVPVLTAFAICPTALVDCLPLLFFNGVSGSGKSQLIGLMRQLWNSHATLNAGTTATALRNEITSLKYKFPGYENSEHIIHGLVFDDVNALTFKNQLLFLIMKGRISRSTDTIKIADSKNPGENFSFRVFGACAISSVAPIASFQEFQELDRRLLTIHTLKDETVSVVNTEQINWDGLYKFACDFWQADRCSEFVNNLRSFNQRIKREEGRRLKASQATISLSLLATGLTAEIWQSEDEAIEAVAAYWQYDKSKKESKRFSTLKEIDGYIKLRQKEWKKSASEFEFSNRELLTYINKRSREGCLDVSMKPAQIAAHVRDKGFVLVDGYWVPMT